MNSTEAWEVFDGLMLGDGGLRRCKNTVYYYMNMSKQSIPIEDHLKYEYWLKDNVFSSLGIEATVRLGAETTCLQTFRGKLYGGKKCLVAHLWTKGSPLLMSCWNEWYSGGEWTKSSGNVYIRNAIKILPKRIMENSNLPIYSLAHWFLNDGGSSRRNDYPYNVHVTFSTHSFNVSEVYHLINILNAMGIATVKPEQHGHIKGSGLQIWLSQSSVDFLMSLIELHVMEIFGDSRSPSYKDMIKYKEPHEVAGKPSTTFNVLRTKLGAQVPC